jgi:hypothetical protein
MSYSNTEALRAHISASEKMIPANYVQMALEDVGSPLPKALSDSLMDYYRDRVSRSRGLPRMGEEVLFLFGDLFSIDRETLIRTAPAWACFYVNCLLIDDQIDIPIRRSVFDPILAQYLADEGHRRFRDVFGSDAPFWGQLQRYRLESWQAITSELRWCEGREGSDRYSTAIRQGRKAAMAKACASALLYGSYGTVLTGRQELGLDFLCAAVQLLDDVNDYREDHEVERGNFLLLHSVKWFDQARKPSRFCDAGEQQLLCSLLLSGAVRDSWTLAADLLSEAMDLLGCVGLSRGENYFRELSDACRTSAQEVAAVELLYLRERGDLGVAVVDSEDATKDALASATIEQMWVEMKAAFLRGPMASN